MAYNLNVKVIVVMMFLMGAVTCMPVVAKAASVPSGLCQMKADRTGVEFKWDAVTGADAYAVQVSADGVRWENDKEDTAATSKVLRGLNAGSTYYVRVASYDMNGTPDFTMDDTMSGYSAPLEVVTAPDAVNIGTMSCTNATVNSLTFAWGACAGATSYRVYDYTSGQRLAVKTEPSFEYTGLIPGANYGIKVVPVRTAVSTGFEAFVNSYGLSGVKTVPETPGTSDFIVYAANSKTKVVNYIVKDESSCADGSEVEVYKVKGGKKVQTLTAAYESGSTASTNSMKVKRNEPYKYRMRYYITAGGKKFYSGWSGYRYFFLQDSSGTKKVGAKGTKIVIKWSKVTGASGYTVSVATKRDGKYTNIKTLGKNKKSITITKVGKKKIKKNKTYYIKVTAKVRDGKGTIKNDTQIINASLQ